MADPSLNSEPLFIEVPLVPTAAPTLQTDSQFTVTSRCPRQKEPEEVVVKQEAGDETQEVKDDLLDELMALTRPSKNERLLCAECHYSTTTAELLLRHVRKMHRGLNPFQCYMCDYSTYNKVLFEEHIRIHRGIKPFKCSYCDYCSASKKNTKKHELIHRPDNPLKCPRCPFIARHQRALVCHRRVHPNSDAEEDKDFDPSSMIKCENCCEFFQTTKQMLSHKRYKRQCHQCDQMLCSRLVYRKHMQDKHQVQYKQIEKPKAFQCEVCEFSTNTKARMLLHLIHHPNQNVDENVLDISILRKYGIMV
ncbi:zinc finger protein 611-like [Ostrinia furnacalis]|uniref:zinc finger protein 611-like n=1 Tax=Ostrinia furnacalis TaxID=93504 RepID=UPI0010391E8F|nr:zinc finger protein 611-like [Ostrinia furnacalis]